MRELLEFVGAFLFCAACVWLVVSTVSPRSHNPACPPWAPAISGNHCNQR